MNSETHEEECRWYILNYISNGLSTGGARKVLDRFNKTHELSLELFAPTYVVREEQEGKIRLRPARLMFHYVFVYGPLNDIKFLCSRNNGFSFLLNRSGAQRYATVSPAEMRQLRNIARVYENALPFYSLDDIDLEEGDLVEVVNGEFPGLIGTYIPKAKGRTGNIVLKVFQNIGTIAYDIKVSDVRVISFAAKSTRANDQIDAIVPHLLKALRNYHANQPNTPALISKLTVFAKRMAVVEIPNQKLEARLRAILYAANRILGEDEAAEKNLKRFEKIKHNVTNPHTSTLVNLLIAVTDRDKHAIHEACASLPAEQGKSAMQKMIAEEAKYYQGS